MQTLLHILLGLWLSLTGSAGHVFGTTITTIQGSDQISASRSTINNNFSNLNTGKAELTSANTFTALNTFPNSSSTKESCFGPCYFGSTATATFSTAGALTLPSALTVANGGTGSTTLASNQVLLGNAAGSLGIVSGFGSSGQALVSNGSATAPSWQSISFDQNANYTLTGTWTFTNGTTTLNATTSIAASSTHPLLLNGVSYSFPSTQGASSTGLSTDGNGKLTWEPQSSFTLAIGAPETSTIANSTTTLQTVAIPANTFASNSAVSVTATFYSLGASGFCSFSLMLGNGSATSAIAYSPPGIGGQDVRFAGMIYATTTNREASVITSNSDANTPFNYSTFAALTYSTSNPLYIDFTGSNSNSKTCFLLGYKVSQER